MLYLDTTFEDLRLMAENTRAVAADPWDVRIMDQRTGTKEALRSWTSAQLAAILALAVADGELGDSITTLLYAIAEPAVEGLPPELRPIP